jgi:outer membrane receptor protein involved in Fe transport
MGRQRRDRSIGTRELVSAVLLALSIFAPFAFAEIQPTPTQAGDIPTLTADIPAQPLARALEEFVRQTGLRLVYVSELVRDQRSRAVPSGLGAWDALGRLLQGTGLQFEYLTPESVHILAAAVGPPKPAARQFPERESLQEVIVTAEKREESLSVVPISANVLTSAELYSAGIEDIGEIAAVTPGVEYDYNSQFGPGILTRLAIRGIESDVGSSTTGVYIDDVPIQWRQSGFANAYPVTFDLTRVEVLRGPQGTLFGAGAEGGSVRFITTEPSMTEFTGLYRSEVSQTRYGGPSFETGAAAGGPIVDGRSGLRISAWYRDDGGYINRVNPFTGATVDGEANRSSSRALRAALVFAPTESLRITPSASYQSVGRHDSPIFYTSLSNPSAGVFDNGKLLRQPSKDSFALASLKVEQQFRFAKLTAVTSYFDRHAQAMFDATNEAGILFFGGYGHPLGPGFPASYSDAIPDMLSLHESQQSEEVRLTSADPEAPIQWVAGQFYSSARQVYTEDIYETGAPGDPGYYNSNQTTDRIVAAYAHVDARLSRQWTLSAGARVDRTRSETTDHAGGFAYPDLAPFTHGITYETPLTPQFSVSYRPDVTNFLYATIAKGFRIGGVNSPVPAGCPTAAPSSYTSDSVWSHEIGAKSRLLDGRLQVAGSVFEIDWSRVQNNLTLGCGFNYVANVGAARSSGFDLDVSVLPLHALNFEVSLGYDNVYFTKTVLTPGGQVLAERDAVVGGVPAVPSPWVGAAKLRYEWPITREITGSARIDEIVHSHNPGPFTELDPKAIGYDPRFVADPATSVLNLRLGLIWSTLDLRLFVNNALDAHPVLQYSADAPGSSLTYAHTLTPRTWGIDGALSF